MKAYSVLEKMPDKKEGVFDVHLVGVYTSLEAASDKLAELIDKGRDAFIFNGHFEEIKDRVILG